MKQRTHDTKQYLALETEMDNHITKVNGLSFDEISHALQYEMH